MNIFATDPDPTVCARQHCDVHLIKMVTETAQLLSAAHIVCDGVQVAYKKTHHNHPCAVWVRASAHNYRWAYTLLCCLLDEYTYRFNKKHATERFRKALAKTPTMPVLGLTQFAIATSAMIGVLYVMLPYFPSDDAQWRRIAALLIMCAVGALVYGVVLLATGFRPHQLKHG